MAPIKASLVLLAAFLSSATEPSPPACNSSYGKLNNTLQSGAINIEQYNGQNGASLGIYSTHIGDYDGFGDSIKDNLPAITQATQAFVPLLRQATIKCNTCVNPDDSLSYSHPYKRPVVQYDDIENIFTVGSNVISALSYKYCDNPTDGVCRDSPSYCPDGDEAPESSVKPLIRQYIRANIAAFGDGPTTHPQLRRTFYPYYDCLATYAVPAVVTRFERKWSAFIQDLVNLNGTECV